MVTKVESNIITHKKIGNSITEVRNDVTCNSRLY